MSASEAPEDHIRAIPAMRSTAQKREVHLFLLQLEGATD